ncbi:MAG: TetR/AcrR family transcriptional regulator [Chloroflexi bacterium]|nr:TetR/AcrR family transcriptional regulator [Chloroflexota bacterium]
MPRLTPTARRALLSERRAQILTAAARVFARKGYERATIADIAREAGVASGSIYRYYKNKGDLLVHIPRQFVSPAVELFQAEAMSPGVPPEQALLHLARSLIGAVRQNADLLRSLVSSVPSLRPAVKARYVEQVPLYMFGQLEAYFSRQIAAGVFRRDLNPKIAARMFPGQFLPYIILNDLLQMPSDEALDYDAVIEHGVRLFLGGALAAPKGKP